MPGEQDFTPISYRYCGSEITVELRSPAKWCVSSGAFVMNSKGQWEIEPLPSNRDEAFCERTRYSLEEAFQVAREAWRKYIEQSEFIAP